MNVIARKFYQRRSLATLSVIKMLVMTFAFIIFSSAAYAACSNNEDGQPGQAGEIEYFTATNELMYCDDTNWILMKEPCGGAQSSCGGDPDERVVFLKTAGAGDFRLGGVLGADQHCTQEARDAKMSGVFYAWLAVSDSAYDPVNRFEHSSVPYIQPDGTQVADDWADLVDCTGSCIDNTIDQYATGVVEGLGQQDVFTNVGTDGAALSYNTADNCDDWTAVFGNPYTGSDQNTGIAWTNWRKTTVCNNSLFVYCFEQQGNDKIGLLFRDNLSVTQTVSPRGIASQGNYVYVVSNSDTSMSSIDVSDPTNMVYSSTFKPASDFNGPRGIAVQGNYAYISTISSHSLYIADITDPTNIIALSGGGGGGGKLVDSGNLNTATAVAVQGNYAYVTARNSNQLVVIDVSDPTTPVIANGGSAKVTITLPNQLDVVGNYAYVLSGADDRLTIVDISDPLNPVIDGSYQNAAVLDGPGWVRVQGNYAYVVGGTTNNFVVFDISDSTNPVVANGGAANITHPFYLDTIGRFVIDGNFAYVTKMQNNKKGITAIDISDPLNPFITATIVQYNNDLDVGYPITKLGNYLFAAGQNSDNVRSYEVVSNYNIGDPCTNAGEYYYDYTEKKMIWCNGTNLIPMDFSGSGIGGCTSPTANEGAMDYDSAGTVFRFCDNGGWVNIGK